MIKQKLLKQTIKIKALNICDKLNIEFQEFLN